MTQPVSKNQLLKPLQSIALSISAALLLIAAWPNSALTPIIAIAWVPLLLLANSSMAANIFLKYVFLTMLVWNAGTTWWLWNATAEGAIAALLINTLLMTIPWWGYTKFKKIVAPNLQFFPLVICWLSFEYIHLNWELSWPWLTLGNALANRPSWIQWYEYTGVAGGSLAIWIGNLLAYLLIVSIIQKAAIKKILLHRLLPFTIYLLGLIGLSKLVSPDSKLSTTKNNIVIVQPNIDPYQKFEDGSAAHQINKLLQLSVSSLDSNTRMIIWPETAMSAVEWQDNILNNIYYQPIFQLAHLYPDVQIVSGIETFKNYGSRKATPTARKMGNGSYYDAFNAAISIQHNRELQFYNKTKLVPGVESLPSFLHFMKPVFEQFGGSTGGYGRSDKAAVFSSAKAVFKAAPIICYESIYGEYIGEFVRNGANVLTILTNDGWWGNTPGHVQHLAYARLRAIETRRWVVRSANTGVSAVIDERGEIIKQCGWNQSAALKYEIPINTELTFYTRYGDYIYKAASILTLLLIAYFWIRKWTRK